MELLAANHTTEDIEALRHLSSRAALATQGKTEDSFPMAMYLYHRTLMELSGNTITPLITNALVSSVLPFWAEYEKLDGTDAALSRLSQFTDFIEQGNSSQAAQLLRYGVEKYKKAHGYL